MSIGAIAAKIARRSHKRTNGVPITYKRVGTSLSLVATIGTTRRDQQSSDGYVSRKQVRDFLIDVADLSLGEPELDDEIEETSGGTIYVYRLVSPGGSEEPFRYSDRHRLVWRLHVELIEEKVAP
jgi:hypothetical protein